MNRKHWAPDHPAVMAWRERGGDSELSLAERRRAVVERMGKPKRDTIKHEALAGIGLVLTSGFVMDNAEKAGGDWWLLVGMLLGGGGALIVDAIRRAYP